MVQSHKKPELLAVNKHANRQTERERIAISHIQIEFHSIPSGKLNSHIENDHCKSKQEITLHAMQISLQFYLLCAASFDCKPLKIMSIQIR